MGKTDFNAVFPQAGAKLWKQQIQYELQGADYNETLVWESPEGIRIKPFYMREDLEGQEIRPVLPGGAPRMGQAIRVTHAEQANSAARKALEEGAEALQFILPAETVKADKLLRGIDLGTTPVHFSFGFLSPAFMEEVLALLPGKPSGVYFHLDIIGRFVTSGNWYGRKEKDFEVVRALLLKTGNRPGVYLLGADGSPYLNAGANRVQQLAYTLAHAHEYLHAFGELLSAPLVFTMAVGPDYFFEIAKLRALRLLWEPLAHEYGLPSACHLVAIPGLRNKTIYDYNNNMLRAASECMSAILGTADTIVNLPYDAFFKEPNPFSSRMALNQLLILKHESGLDKVANPADGAYYIESLSLQLAEKSLSLFKQLEAGGGFLKQLGDHTIQKKIKESAAREQKLFDQGQQVLVGINSAPDMADRMKPQLEAALHKPEKKGKTLIEPLLVKRLAAAMEQKRLADE